MRIVFVFLSVFLALYATAKEKPTVSGSSSGNDYYIKFSNYYTRTAENSNKHSPDLFGSSQRLVLQHSGALTYLMTNILDFVQNRASFDSLSKSLMRLKNKTR